MLFHETTQKSLWAFNHWSHILLELLQRLSICFQVHFIVDFLNVLLRDETCDSIDLILFDLPELEVNLLDFVLKLSRHLHYSSFIDFDWCVGVKFVLVETVLQLTKLFLIMIYSVLLHLVESSELLVFLHQMVHLIFYLITAELLRLGLQDILDSLEIPYVDKGRLDSFKHRVDFLLCVSVLYHL